ncbi:MAG: EFR1 family ferrodoxin [Oscillospiraceae bacterium]|jgi:NAD-dependent dihydropyrimidine dehydrogenase PreA subunit/flavodoxin|nr:EFR1 family ferrodoxin [Oscillospiraceae bacterium]
MIFYFTATGNSQYAAEKIAGATDDRLVSIGAALRNGSYEYDVTGDSYLGFVLPTFAGTLPGAVGLFFDKLKLTGYGGQFVYGVFTCGASDGFESAALYTVLKSRGIAFDGSYELVMPDNFIVWSNIPSGERLAAMLARADKRLDEIIAAIRDKKPGKLDVRAPQPLYMPLSELSTAKNASVLHADDKCTACGLCAEICPMGCIKRGGDSRPVWEGSCTMCLACLHRCPAAAVQHGRDTQNKARYVNPNVKLT